MSGRRGTLDTGHHSLNQWHKGPLRRPSAEDARRRHDKRKAQHLGNRHWTAHSQVEQTSAPY
eukprot:7694786-Alexandrium_andersonii.AAC.1